MVLVVVAQLILRFSTSGQTIYIIPVGCQVQWCLGRYFNRCLITEQNGDGKLNKGVASSQGFTFSSTSYGWRRIQRNWSGPLIFLFLSTTLALTPCSPSSPYPLSPSLPESGRVPWVLPTYLSQGPTDSNTFEKSRETALLVFFRVYI